MSSKKNYRNLLYVIENEASFNVDIMQDFAGREDFAAFHFKSLREVLSARRPDIIIADLKTIDEGKGISVLKARFSAPIVILSERGTMASAVKALRFGANDFFPKPVSFDALYERLTVILKQDLVTKNQNASPDNTAIRPFWEHEKEIIQSALNLCNGNISRAAAALQISPSTIYRKKQFWNEQTLKART